MRPGLAPAEDFSVLVHELAHELLHRKDRAFTPPERAFIALVRTMREWPA